MSIEDRNDLCYMSDDLGFVNDPQWNITDLVKDEKFRVWKGPFTFVHIGDPQFGLIEKFYLKKENPKWDEEIRITKLAIEQINNLQPKPKFLFIGGDMLDTRPGTIEEQATRKLQYADFMETFSLLDPEIRIIACAGNHDVCDIATEDSIKNYKAEFGPDFFGFWFGGVKFIVLNSQYWKSSTSVPSLFEQHQKFMEGIAEGSSEAKFLISFQHIPFFVEDPNEEDVSYLNIEKEFRFKAMDTLEEAGVKYILCGHYHRNGGGSYKGMEQVITSALCNPLGDDPCGYRLVTINHDRITSDYIPLEFPSADPTL